MNHTYRLKQALTDLRNGRPVLVYDSDDREGEVDMILPAETVDHTDIAQLRNDAGGLICTVIPHDAAERLELPYYRNIIDHPAAETEEPAYGDHSSFALWVNHRDTYTGITDNDRATTATALADAVANEDYAVEQFADDFKTPGHVAVLRAANGLLKERQGHTEMSIYLVQKAGLTPAAVICEMLDGTTGDALSKDDAETYAQENNLTLLDGDTVVQDFEDVMDKIQF